MVEDINVPAACDIYDLQSALLCDQCSSHLGSRPVTTRCGHSFCRDCLITAGQCPNDACRSYSSDDCPHDVVLGDLLEEIHRIIADADAKGVWRKRKRAIHGSEKRWETKEDTQLIDLDPKGKEVTQSPDSRESLQLRYKKVDNEPSPPKPLDVPSATPNAMPRTADVESVEKPTDLNMVDDALTAIKSKAIDSMSPLETNPNLQSEPLDLNAVGSQPPTVSKMLDRQARQEFESKDNDLWKILRRNVAESFFTCSVCSNCYLEPMTLRCGHTFCRECFHHSIDQSSYHPEKGFTQPTCPSCRNITGPLLPKGEAPHHENTWNWTNNLHMWKLINHCWIPELEESKFNFKGTTKTVPDGMEYPLFVCAAALPTQPTDLRVFEPRYRTMLRRILRTPDRTFVMSLGTSNRNEPFKKIGVLLQIQSVVYEELEVSFPSTVPPTKDMETYVFTKGVARVSIEESMEHDGYLTARTTKIVDNDSNFEVSAELEQVGYMRVLDPLLSNLDFDPDTLSLDWLAAALPRYSGVITRLRTLEIMHLLREFVSFEENRVGPAAWTRDIIENRGPLPDDSCPSEFGWWITGLFFRSQSDRQQLLEMTSPRKRLVFLLNRVGRAWARLQN
jgi:Lon protease-like protein